MGMPRVLLEADLAPGRVPIVADGLRLPLSGVPSHQVIRTKAHDEAVARIELIEMQPETALELALDVHLQLLVHTCGDQGDHVPFGDVAPGLEVGALLGHTLSGPFVAVQPAAGVQAVVGLLAQLGRRETRGGRKSGGTSRHSMLKEVCGTTVVTAAAAQ